MVVVGTGSSGSAVLKESYTDTDATIGQQTRLIPEECSLIPSNELKLLREK